jgi:hypothetical protein
VVLKITGPLATFEFAEVEEDLKVVGLLDGFKDVEPGDVLHVVWLLQTTLQEGVVHVRRVNDEVAVREVVLDKDLDTVSLISLMLFRLPL